RWLDGLPGSLLEQMGGKHNVSVEPRPILSLHIRPNFVWLARSAAAGQRHRSAGNWDLYVEGGFSLVEPRWPGPGRVLALSCFPVRHWVRVQLFLERQHDYLSAHAAKGR